MSCETCKPQACGCAPQSLPGCPADYTPDIDQSAHTGCACQTLPRDIVDVITPLYQAMGGRLYRLLLATKANAVFMGDGSSVELRINTMERALAQNTTMRFADDIAGRNALKGLVPGDTCLVFDATADPTVRKGSAAYIWLPSLQWKKIHNGDTPIDPENFILPGGGLDTTDEFYRRVFVDWASMPIDTLRDLLKNLVQTGYGLIWDAAGRIAFDPANLIGYGISRDANGKIIVNTASIIDTAHGLATDANGKIFVRLLEQYGLVWKSGQIAFEPANLITGAGGLKIAADGRLAVDPPQFLNGEHGLIIGADGRIDLNTEFIATRQYVQQYHASNLPALANQGAPGLMSAADKQKLDGITAGAQPNPGLASQSSPGLMSAADKQKLDSLSTSSGDSGGGGTTVISGGGMIPNYNGVQARETGSTYTAATNGYAMMSTSAPEGSGFSYCTITVNGSLKFSACSGVSNSSSGTATIVVPLAQGNTYSFTGTGGSFYECKFIPAA